MVKVLVRRVGGIFELWFFIEKNVNIFLNFGFIRIFVDEI